MRVGVFSAKRYDRESLLEANAGPQAFFTAQALRDIATTTLNTITLFEQGAALTNRVA